MEIDPRLQLQLLLSAFLLGVLAGPLPELINGITAFIGGYAPPERMRQRYAHPLPILHCGVPFERKRLSRVLGGLLRGFGDLLYCVALAVALVLLNFRYQNGAFRLSVPIAMLAGLALCRIILARALALILDYVAYGLAAFAQYRRALWRFWRRWLKKATDRILRPLRIRMEQKKKEKIKKKGRTDHGKTKNRRKNNGAGLGDPYSDHHHLRGIARHQHGQADEVERKPSARRGATRAKGAVRAERAGGDTVKKSGTRIA